MAEAGLRAGDRLRVTATEPGRLTLVREESALETYAGRLTGTYPPNDLDNLRDEWHFGAPAPSRRAGARRAARLDPVSTAY